MRAAALLAAVALLAGGAVAVAAPAVSVARDTDWRRVATSADRARLRGWRATWLTALSTARAADPKGVAAEGQLFDPDRALADAVPPAGTYRCRTFKLGTKGNVTGGFIAYPWFECRVDERGGVATFRKINGSQRPVGLIFSDSAGRSVFLGTLALGDESGALDYGRDANRDMAALVQRVGVQRWRIAFPAPRFESQLDVMELVPTG